MQKLGTTTLGDIIAIVDRSEIAAIEAAIKALNGIAADLHPADPGGSDTTPASTAPAPPPTPPTVTKPPAKKRPMHKPKKPAAKPRRSTGVPLAAMAQDVLAAAARPMSVREIYNAIKSDPLTIKERIDSGETVTIPTQCIGSLSEQAAEHLQECDWFTCNVMFRRTVRKPHRKKCVETRCVQGCVVDQPWDGDGPTIRADLMRHAPPGEGWMVGGYARVSNGKDETQDD